jgi:hypothetical protein
MGEWRGKMETKTKREAIKGGRMEYWNNGILGKSPNRSSFIIPPFHSSNIPHWFQAGLLWER